MFDMYSVSINFPQCIKAYMLEKIEDVLQDFEDVKALASIAVWVVYHYLNVHFVYPFTSETVDYTFHLSKFVDYFSFTLLSLLVISIFKYRLPFYVIETEDYTLHLPEFVDHFYEWDRNKDSFITMDEVKISYQSLTASECLG